MKDLSLSPYANTARDYLASGWDALPLPYAMKSPPPEGYTGEKAKKITAAKQKAWMNQSPKNVALRMPDGVIGIDIDRCKETGKAKGWDLFQSLQQELGPLPISIVSTSREDLKFGFTAFFRVPKGTKLKGGIAGLIDIIQTSHRYQVVFPSIHEDSGRMYEWRTFPSNKPTPFFPDVETLPELPEAWLKYLSETPKKAPQKPRESSASQLPEDAPAMLSGLSCAAMRTNAGRRINELNARMSSRHDAMVRATFCIVLAGHAGHAGIASALEQYFTAWSHRFSPQEAQKRDLRAEFDAGVQSAKAKMVGSSRGSCGCMAASRGGAYRKARQMSDVKMWR